MVFLLPGVSGDEVEPSTSLAERPLEGLQLCLHKNLDNQVYIGVEAKGSLPMVNCPTSFSVISVVCPITTHGRKHGFDAHNTHTCIHSLCHILAKEVLTRQLSIEKGIEHVVSLKKIGVLLHWCTQKVDGSITRSTLLWVH